MEIKKLRSVVGTFIAVSTLAAFGLLETNAYGLVGVVGPSGEVITYERDPQTHTMIMRRCAKANLTPIEMERGCDLAEEIPEIRVPHKDFATIAGATLSTLSREQLRSKHQEILDRYKMECATPAHEDEETIAMLKIKLQRIQTIKKDFPAEYDKKEEEALLIHLQCVQTRFLGTEEAWALIKPLITHMAGKTVKTLLSFAKIDHTKIEYNFLKDLVETCHTAKTAVYPAGTVCRTSKGNFWRIEQPNLWESMYSTPTHSGQTVTDLTNGFTVSNTGHLAARQGAIDLCKTKSERIPTTEAVLKLEASGVREVLWLGFLGYGVLTKEDTQDPGDPAYFKWSTVFRTDDGSLFRAFRLVPTRLHGKIGVWCVK